MGGFTKLAAASFPGRGVVPITTLQQKKWDSSFGMDAETEWGTWELVKRSTTFWATLEPLVTEETLGQIDSLRSWANIYFVTSRVGDTVLEQTSCWLKNSGIGWPNVIVTSAKGEIAHALKADYMIDDKVGNCIYTYYQTKDIETLVYILHRPYNQFDHDVVGKGIKRVLTVEEFLDDIVKGGK